MLHSTSAARITFLRQQIHQATFSTYPATTDALSPKSAGRGRGSTGPLILGGRQINPSFRPSRGGPGSRLKGVGSGAGSEGEQPQFQGKGRGQGRGHRLGQEGQGHGRAVSSPQRWQQPHQHARAPQLSHQQRPLWNALSRAPEGSLAARLNRRPSSTPPPVALKVHENDHEVLRPLRMDDSVADQFADAPESEYRPSTSVDDSASISKTGRVKASEYEFEMSDIEGISALNRLVETARESPNNSQTQNQESKGRGAGAAFRRVPSTRGKATPKRSAQTQSTGEGHGQWPLASASTRGWTSFPGTRTAQRTQKRNNLPSITDFTTPCPASVLDPTTDSYGGPTPTPSAVQSSLSRLSSPQGHTFGFSHDAVTRMVLSRIASPSDSLPGLPGPISIAKFPVESTNNTAPLWAEVRGGNGKATREEVVGRVVEAVVRNPTMGSKDMVKVVGAVAWLTASHGQRQEMMGKGSCGA